MLKPWFVYRSTASSDCVGKLLRANQRAGHDPPPTLVTITQAQRAQKKAADIAATFVVRISEAPSDHQPYPP
jgi:hypothetical protein